ncbi:MAG: CapA family protein [Lachnospiraceae bacterium]
MTNKTAAIQIGFTGDLSFSGYFSKAYKQEQVYAESVKQFLAENDANVINQESPVTQCRVTKKRRLAHRSDPEVISYIKEQIPNPVFSLANNHMMDYNRIGMMDTLDNMKETGSEFIGAGNNIEEASRYVVIGEDVKVAILSLQYKNFRVAGKRKSGPFHESRKDVLAERIAQMRKEADWVVVVYHGGDEFLYAPMPYTRKLLHSYLDLGADIVVAHHPHVVQGYETVGKKMIFYSLGNFMFDTDYQRVQEGTTEGMLLRLSFTKDSYEFSNMPIHINRDEHTVEPGEANPHFIDYAKAGYQMYWCKEAYRKEETLNRAKELREKALEEMQQVSENEKVKYQQLRMELEMRKAKEDDREGNVLDEGDVDDGTKQEELDGGESLSFSVKTRRFLKNTKKKSAGLIGGKRKNTYRRGRFLYKLLYKNKI